MNEERIMELEIKVAYQEDLLQELNKIVAEQQSEITGLVKTCKILNEKIKSFSEGVDVKQNLYEMPPHY